VNILAAFAPLYDIVGVCLLARAFFIPTSPRHDAAFGFAILIVGLFFQFLAASGTGLPSEWWPVLLVLLLVLVGVWAGFGARLRQSRFAARDR
jgi:hypothetical protein